MTIVAALVVGEEGRVYSIEPHPKIYQYLLANLQLNNLLNVEAFNHAVGNQSGSIAFSNVRSDDQNQVLHGEAGISVPIKKLDDLLVSDRSINLLKIDVEGYEKFVIEGSSRILAHTDCVYFESSEENFVKFSYCTTELINLFKQQGFSCFKFLNLSTITPIETGYISTGYENLIAVKDVELFLSRTGFVFEGK